MTVLSIITWLIPKSSSNSVYDPPARLDTQLNYALWDFNGQLLDQQGNIHLQISSPLLRKVAQSEVATIKSPQIRIKQADQQWHITAESAIITADREYISLIGDVNMLRLNEISGETLKITTRDVMLKVTPRTASTPGRRPATGNSPARIYFRCRTKSRRGSSPPSAVDLVQFRAHG
ncbi:MAG: LPS export ABC transporter periplasmic protein LptC [Proteobacteria bacterium]|nr:LPS export ABC transporter periplasmic protein LptC [Pseudomonadota bacterium]